MGSTLQLKLPKSEEFRCQMTSSMPVLTTLIVAWHARLLNTLIPQQVAELCVHFCLKISNKLQLVYCASL